MKTMFNILTVASAVEAAFTAAEDVVTEFNVLKPYVTQLMQSAETAYSSAENAGSSKLSAVLASVKAIAGALGVSWSSGLESTIVAFINVAKAAFNAFAGVVTTVAPSTSSAVSSASNAVANVTSQAAAALASTVASPAAAS
jgi:hypothetical protein